MKGRPLGHVVTYTVPVECGLPTDVEALEASLQQDEAGLQGGRVIRAAIDATRQPLQPARTDIVDREVSRYAEGGEILGGQRRSRSQMAVEPV